MYVHTNTLIILIVRRDDVAIDSGLSLRLGCEWVEVAPYWLYLDYTLTILSLSLALTLYLTIYTMLAALTYSYDA